ncbi:MAG: phosphate ABC transporter permease PstA [Pirellula sp.]|jgi:phosphate transport system permease protein|nr:phosphate ABC transporter permease PstA [Pirellula sp.]
MNRDSSEIDKNLLAISIERRWSNRRTLMNLCLTIVTGAIALVACLPLASLLYMLVKRGANAISLSSFTQLPPAPMQEGGGFGNAIVGTLTMVLIGAILSIPVGVLSAIYLSILGPDSRTATLVRFTAKILSGLPSILAGVFAYTLVVVTMKTYSAPAGGVALAVLMVPIVILTSEEAFRMVPKKMIEAAIGMGCTPTQAVWKVILPTAFPSLLTGVMLAVARAAGETAPLLFTALFSNYWIWQDSRLSLMEPTASLAVFIYNSSGSPFDNQIEMAWAAALVLVVLILALNLIAQFMSRKQIRG